MKRILTLLNSCIPTFLIIYACFVVRVNVEASSPGIMDRFLEGCRLTRSAIEKNDLLKLTDAKIIFAGLRLAEFSEDDYWIENEEERGRLESASVFFTSDFVSELARSDRERALASYDSAHLMRDGDYDLKLLHASIMPRSIVSFSTEGVDLCEMALFALTNDGLGFEIVTKDGNVVYSMDAGKKSEHYARWTFAEDDPTVFRFIVRNAGDKTESFVIAIN